MEKKLKITLACIAFAIILQYASVLAAVVCPLPALTVPGMPATCGNGLMLDATGTMCCMNIADTPGGTGNYCSIPAKLMTTGAPQCPPTHPYFAPADMCCGPSPITVAQMMAAAANASAQAAALAAQAAAGGANGANCVDKAVAGRASDCPANAALCNNTLYYQLMTDQCPKTCGRCPAVGTNNAAVAGGNARGNGCVDGTNAQGVSECPQNAGRCTAPIWSAFMMKECPFTCNPACKTGGVTVATTAITTTTLATG